MSRLPTPGGDNGTWGQLLNDFLVESHDADGVLKDDIVTETKIANNAVATAKLADGAVTAAKLDSTVNSQLTSASTAVQTVNGKSGTSVSIDYADMPTAPTVTRTYASGAYPARASTGIVIWIGPSAPAFGSGAAADGDMWINNA